MYLFLPSALHNNNTPSKNAWVDWVDSAYQDMAILNN